MNSIIEVSDGIMIDRDLLKRILKARLFQKEIINSCLQLLNQL